MSCALCVCVCLCSVLCFVCVYMFMLCLSLSAFMSLRCMLPGVSVSVLYVFMLCVFALLMRACFMCCM